MKLVKHYLNKFLISANKYPQASINTLNNLRRVILPELMHNPKYLMCKNSGRIDPTITNKNNKQKVISKFLENK